MLIRLETIQESPFRWKETVEVKAADVDMPELVELGPISWQGEVTFTDPDYYLSATYEYEQVLACVRCLTEVKDKVAGEFQLLLTQEKVPEGVGEIALTEDDLGYVHLDGEEIELNEFLDEQIALNVPMKPQCRPDCQGLCSECGANLNEGSCDCDKKPVDPRWQALAGIKEKLDESN